jgi:DNA-directed RNA polymerase II subunit RPB1
MACVGQQNVEGKRIPFGFNRRSLPHFSKDDFGPESKGFVTSCYVSGLTPQEFYFHAMGGREGLIDTAVKTADTGYIQRRLIKALEDVQVKYDATVRTSRDQVLQFIYGEDGMAAERIEDLSIPLLGMDNQKMEKEFRFFQDGSDHAERRQALKASVQDAVVTQMSPQALDETADLLAEEYKQLTRDREALRTVIHLPGDDEKVHLPVDVPRLLWTAREQAAKERLALPGGRARDTTDLTPFHVIT